MGLVNPFTNAPENLAYAKQQDACRNAGSPNPVGNCLKESQLFFVLSTTTLLKIGMDY
jgi:hypothetical protein